MVERRRRLLCASLTALALALLMTPAAPGQAPAGWIQDTEWLLLGPLGQTGGCDPGNAVQDNWIAPEEIAAIAPADGDPVAIDFDTAASVSWQGEGAEPAWTCLAGLGLPGSDLVDLVLIAGALGARSGKTIPITDVMAVLVTYVTNHDPDPLPVTVCTASDDSLQVWVNDQKVQEVHACRGTAGGCAEEAPALLVPGVNVVKVLLWQGLQGWSFRLRLKRLDSGPITSFDPAVSFSCQGGAGAPSLDASRVRRQLGLEVTDCAASGGTLEVKLQGESLAGGSVDLTESVQGEVEVEDIAAGGVFTPSPPPPAAPVGIFDGSADVGSPCDAGSASLNLDGSYTVRGSGFDIWTEGDNFHFAYKLAHGDFSLTARVASRTWAPGSRWGKAGLMARQSLGGKSRYTSLQTHGEDPQDADRFAARPTHGGADNFEVINLSAGEHRDWLRLERSGSLFVGSFSVDDGLTWEPAGAVEWGPEAPHTVLLGLAVTSHAGCEAAEITFDQVELWGGDSSPGPLPPDGGTIVWNDLPAAALAAGVSYRLRGLQRVALHGNDGQHAVEGEGQALLLPAAAAAGIFPVAHDIGGPCAPGSTFFDPQEGTYQVTAGGNDIWENGDQFQYAYRQVTGDFTLRARFRERNWAADERWGKAGLMARERCDPDSRYSFMHDSPDPDSARFAVQRVTGAPSNLEFGQGGHPDWLRLDRVGKQVAGYSSDDGVVWRLRYKEDWIDPMPQTILAGLAYTSHGGCTPGTVVFDEVSLNPIDYLVSRRAGAGLPGCPPAAGGNAVAVELRGTGSGGASVRILEEVRGQVEVEAISHGGVFTPTSKPGGYQPVGMWADARDIGEPCTPGSTVDHGDGSYTVTGGGADIWQTGDQFHFAYVEASGDFSLTARIAERNWALGSRWGKVGLMARQSHDPRSRYLGVQDHGIDAQDQTRWAARPAHGGADNYETVPLLAFEHHDWLRLERVGDLFIGSSSLDGLTWVEQGRQVWSTAPATVLLGLEVCSHADCSTASIRFDNIEYLGGNGAPGAVPEGGTISWQVPRSALDQGVTYRVTTRGNSLASFTGSADEVEITGDSSYSIAGVQALPGQLNRAHDIGNPCVQGSTSAGPESDTYTVTGSGSDIWQTGDQFQFAYREVTGDFFVAIAHIRERQWAPGSRWGKVGIMARQDCTPRSAYAMIQDHGEDLQDETRFAARPSHGGADNFERDTSSPGTHYDWMRLDRAGSVFSGYVSANGQDWLPQGIVDFGVNAPPGVLLGLAVCSHDGCDPATITFDQVRIITEANHPPVACLQTRPSPPAVSLVDGKAEIVLDAACSSDGDGGTQGITYLWTRVTGPRPPVIENRTGRETRVTFDRLGSYRLRLTVNDGQLTASTSSVEVTVVVTDQPPPPRFRRGDVNGDRLVDISDPIGILGYLFLGQGEKVVCIDAADLRDRGQIDIADPIFLLNFLFQGGPAPSTPGPAECGPDLGQEAPDLGCAQGCL